MVKIGESDGASEQTGTHDARPCDGPAPASRSAVMTSSSRQKQATASGEAPLRSRDSRLASV